MPKIKISREKIVIVSVMAAMLLYFLLATPHMADDGFQYEGFAESLAHGHLDFKSFYGTQGLSILAVPIFWLTGSHISIIITSEILVLLSIPLVFILGKEFWKSEEAGVYMIILFLLACFPYVTLMRGFQEAAVYFFSFLIIYLSVKKSKWAPLVWAFGSIVKPFNLFLFPIFINDFLNKKKFMYFSAGILLGIIYLGFNYHQTGHLINDSLTGTYSGDYSLSRSPSILSNFTLNIKGPLRIAANILIESRKIMISPLVMILGFFGLMEGFYTDRSKKFLYSFISLFLFLSLLVFTFPKYLMPNIAIASLFTIPLLLRHKWLMSLVILDSITVFYFIYRFHGHNYWSISTFYLPLFYSFLLYIYIFYSHKTD